MEIERDVDKVWGLRRYLALEQRDSDGGLSARVNISLRWLSLGRIRCVAYKKPEENKHLKERRIKTHSINSRLNITLWLKYHACTLPVSLLLKMVSLGQHLIPLTPRPIMPRALSLTLPSSLVLE